MPASKQGFARCHAARSSIAASSGAAYSCTRTDGSSRRSRISGTNGLVPRTDSDRNRPLRAETDDRKPFTRSRSLSTNKPISSTIARSKPEAAPLLESADRTSTVPHVETIFPGAGDRRNLSPSRPDAAAIASHCIFSSFAFPLLTDATPARHPNRRKGPAKCARSTTAIAADFAFFLAISSSTSRMPGR